MDSIFVSNPNTVNYIPPDIIIDILTKLPVKSLLRFKGVCKSWYLLIKDDKFIKQHYDHTRKNCQKYFMVARKYKRMKKKFDYYHYTMDVPQLDSSSIASLVESPVPITDQSLMRYIQYFSCNGILLIAYPYDIIVLWNPATRESRRIPCPIQSKTGGLYNFSYFPRIDGYKIFRLGPGVNNGDSDDKDIDIFSTKTNTWKSVGVFPPNYGFLSTSVVMSNGIVYMRARRGEIDYTILRFCLEKEQFLEELLFPSPIPHALFSLGEEVCLFRSLRDDNHEICELWLYMMKTNSWNKILTIPLAFKNSLTPLSFIKDGSMMFQKYNRCGFVAYNSTTHKLKKVNVRGIKGLYFNKVVTYVETLSSPNS